MKIIHMTLKKKWFDMILSGEKSEEYRTMKSYWQTRLDGGYDAICFKNGYASSAPKFVIELKKIRGGLGKEEWGAPVGKQVYILELGKIIRN